MPTDQYGFEKGGPRPGFEKQWLAKLNRCLEERLPDHAESVMEGAEHQPEDTGPQVIEWTRALLGRLEKIDSGKAADVMAGCACQYPKPRLAEMRKTYQETGDIDRVHAMLQEQFLENTKGFLNLSDEEVDGIEERGWGVAGMRKGSTIIATKMPFDWPAYWAAEDSDMRRFHYCHCPRVRDIIKDGGEPLSKTYCYCGAGFYKGIWEYILGEPVEVEVQETVMHGDDVCKIAIRLPKNS
ncbi:MAG: DUF6144 family protein [Candidatus Bathyarchaeota archaeon]